MWQVYDRNVGMSLKRKEPKKQASTFKLVQLRWYGVGRRHYNHALAGVTLPAIPNSAARGMIINSSTLNKGHGADVSLYAHLHQYDARAGTAVT